MKLRELLEQLPEYYADRDVKFVFKATIRHPLPEELIVDRITILGDVTITLIEK